jgi:hypothetical protein
MLRLLTIPIVRLAIAGLLLATLMGLLAVLTGCGPSTPLPAVPTSPTVNLTPDDPGAIGGGR